MGNRQTAPSRRWTLGGVLWILVMLIMASFQTWRGASVDGVLVYSVALLLVVDWLTGERLRIAWLRAIPRWVVWSTAAVAAVILTLAPRHGVLVFVVMALLGVTMLVLSWGPPSHRANLAQPAVRKSAWIWAILGIALCVWEALAFVLSVTLPGGINAYPTVSVLLDPVLQTLIGRGTFVALWGAAGVGLVMIWRRL